MKRRSFLAAGAALALAPLGCRRKGGLTFEGELAGPSLDFGHMVRDGNLPVPTSFRPLDVIIVGGGIAGLSAAWRLKGAGVENFRLLELELDLGGTSRSGRNAVSAFPWAAHYVPAPAKDAAPMVRLMRECGVLEGFDAAGEPVYGEQHLVRALDERLFAYGAWWEGLYLAAGAEPEDVRQYHAFFQEIDAWVAYRDAQGRRAFAIPRAKASDAPEVQSLDRQSFAQWLDRRHLDSPRLRWYLEYACRDDYGATLDTTSAWAGIFYFAARKQAPGEDSRKYLTWPEGNGFLVNHLERQIAGQVEKGIAVTSIRQMGPNLVQVHAFNTKDNTAIGFEARKVIFSAPMMLAPYMIPALWEARPEGFMAFAATPWIVANLTLRSRPREGHVPLAWDNVLMDSTGLGYVVATHQSCVDHGPTVWTYYHPFTGPDIRGEWKRLMDMGWKECARLILDDLRRAHPDLEAHVTRVDVMRWAHAMVRPRPGFMFSQALRQAREPFQNIHFAHSDLSGFALFEEAQDHGLRAAEEVLAALGKPQPTWR